MEQVTDNEAVLEARNLIKDFPLHTNGLKRPMMRALNDVSFTLHKRRALAVVGESGSGKSTTARLIARMYQPTEGEITYRGRSIASIRGRRASLAYRASVQMVWQDPFGSLNPTHTIYHHIARPLLLHRKVSGRRECRERVHDLMDQVGLVPVVETADKYPHQLSGGQRQRVNIARNLAVDAEVVLADEPTSMLDVSIRAGILNLLEDMKHERGLALMYITHDLGTARYLAEEIAVMYVGHMVEWGDSESVIQNPQHPYTQLLISAVPNPDRSIHERLEGEKGEIPLWTPQTRGCPFAGRCPHTRSACHDVMPGTTEVAAGHYVRCHLYGE